MTEIVRTWGEFKAAVEAAGVKDDDGIRYIDWVPAVPPAVERNEETKKVTIE